MGKGTLTRTPRPPTTQGSPLTFWLQIARETLHWDRDFQTVRAGGFENGDITWFPEGGLNASYNCVDRWAYKDPNKASARRESTIFLPALISPRSLS